MERIKVFTTKFIDQLNQKLQSDSVVAMYTEGKSPIYSDNDTRDTVLEIDSFPHLSTSNTDFENAKILYESLGSINRTMASDFRLWTWLSHVPFMDYMSKRWPVQEQEKEKAAPYIERHWFVKSQTGGAYTDHGIALLWWGAHVTHDPKRDNPYELTEALFKQLDVTTTIFGKLGSSNVFTHALLEYIIENPDLFGLHRQNRVRLLMIKLNYITGYKVLPGISKNEIKKLIDRYRPELEKVTK